MEEKLTENEILLAKECITLAKEAGAEKVRVTLNKSLMELFGMLDGELDKVTHALDRSLSIVLFVDGKSGSFSTNRLVKEDLKEFITRAVSTVRMLAKDECRDLPSPDRTVKKAVKGNELGLYDKEYETLTPEKRLTMAKSSSIWKGKEALEKGFRIISEEGEYSDSVFDTVTIDSNGLYARHTETSFEIGYEVTVEDPQGNRISAYWWDASPTLKGICGSLTDCSMTAVKRAAGKIGPRPHEGGLMNLVVDSECASKVVSPILNALSGHSIQQKNSFLTGKKGEKVFGENVTIIDRPHEEGKTGSRLFDSEGVATGDLPIIENGVVKNYFINTYIAGKLGIEPTIEDCSRPVLSTVGDSKEVSDLLEKVGSGIYVTGFNGGNSNSATGDFSYGIEGFAFENGKILHPVREMLMTGNFIDLWNNLIATADDARSCMSKIIPTLAFSNVYFAG